MKGYSITAKAGILSVLAVLLAVSLLLSGSPSPASVLAGNPVAISGSFYTQKFQVPVGGRVYGSSIYVVAFNWGTEAARFVMSYTAPADVTLEFSPEAEFILNPSQSRQVFVAVHVGPDAVPGLHEIAVNVRAERGEGSGVVILGAAEQVAPLSIVGEAGNVLVETVSPRGDRIMTHIRLWKIIEGDRYEFADSHTGVLDTVVSPGTYLVKAFSMGVELASQEFDIAHLEQKNIRLEVETIFFKYFDVSLARHVRTGAPGYARVSYTVANVYRPVSNASVNLEVRFDGEYLETVPGILTLSTLNLGDTGVPYSYIPGTGWEDGTYSFYLELYIGGQPYARTTQTHIEIDIDGPGRSMAWLWILLGILGTAGLSTLIFFLLKRRKKGEEKPRKAEKKRKEEKPPRRAEEPVRQPEPVVPSVMEEPSENPAPLATISTLKARMAALERDRSAGIAAEEEEVPEAGETIPASPSAGAEAAPPTAKTEAVKERKPKPPKGGKPADHRKTGGIISRVGVTKEPPRPPTAQGPAPPRPVDEIRINWPPRSAGLAEAARLKMEAQQRAESEAPSPTEPGGAEEAAEQQVPPPAGSLAEALRLRTEARQRAAAAGETGAAEGPAPEAPPASESGEEDSGELNAADLTGAKEEPGERKSL